MLRVLTSSIRLGAYEPVKAHISPLTGEGTLTQKVLSGMISGAIGASIASPTDLIKVRSFLTLIVSIVVD